MGVKGLTTYIDARPYLTKPHKLHDTKVVIDGNNLIHFLYASKKLDCVHGGDYFSYATEVKKYFTCLKDCNIEPIIVLDGGNDVEDYMFPTRLQRFKKRLERVNRATTHGICDESFVPVNISEVFKSLITEMKIPFVQCDYESDSHVAALANHFDCPVLSDDSDFYIFNVRRGFIRLSHIDKFVTTVFLGNGTASKHLKCEIYHIDTFLTYHPKIGRNSLPLLATLVGNDFVSFDSLKPFYNNLPSLQGKRIDGIIDWLSEHRMKEAVTEVLEHVHEEERKEIEFMIKVSVESYELKVSNLVQILDNRASYIDKQLATSKLVTPCGTLLPEWFITAFNKGQLRGYFMTIINVHRLFLSPQVGDPTYESCYSCSRYIRRILYGILLQHDAYNKKIHGKECTQFVKEYDCCNGREKIVMVKSILSTPNGRPLPSLSKIYNMPKAERRKLLIDAMRVKESFLLFFAPDFQLLFGSISYWLMNCSTKPLKEFIVAMIISFIYFNVLQKPIDEACTKADPSKKTYEYFSVLEKISEAERQVVSKRFQMYLAESSDKTRDPFRVKIIHSYNELQTCLLYLISLNKLLNLPFESPKLHELINGTFLCHLTDELLRSPCPGIFVDRLLGRNTACCNFFNMLLCKILDNISENFPWSKPYYRTSSEKKLLQNKAVNIAEVSNKFQSLCSLKRH